MATTDENTKRLEAIQDEIRQRSAAIENLQQEQERLHTVLRRHYVRRELYAHEVQRLELLLAHTDDVAGSVYQELLRCTRRLYRAAKNAREAERQAHERTMEALRKQYLPLEMAKQDRLQLLREKQATQAEQA